MNHLAWDQGAIDSAFESLGLPVLPQKTTKTECNQRVKSEFALPITRRSEIDCPECIDAMDVAEGLAELFAKDIRNAISQQQERGEAGDPKLVKLLNEWDERAATKSSTEPTLSPRIFTDRMHITFGEKIRASAAKRTTVGHVAWLRSEHVGPTGKPYTLRRLGIVIGDSPTEYARCDRRGRVFWHTISYGFTIETESDNQTNEQQ